MNMNRIIRIATHVVAIINIGFFLAAVTAKEAQMRQAHMLAGPAASIASACISACGETWLLGAFGITVMRRRGQCPSHFLTQWRVVIGIPVVLFYLAMFLFILPAFI